MSGTPQLDSCIGYLLIAAYAALFAWAAYLKLRDMRAFSAVLEQYRLMPKVLAAAAAWCVALTEAAIAILLLPATSRTAAALLGAALCLLYALAIGINLRRGRRELDCGCSGPLKRRPISAWMPWRNGALAAGLLAVCLPWSARTMNGVDLLTIGGGALGAALLYATLDSLMAIPASA